MWKSRKYLIIVILACSISLLSYTIILYSPFCTKFVELFCLFSGLQRWMARQQRVSLNRPITYNGPDLKHYRLTSTIHLTLKMTSAQVVETSVTNNSSFQNYTHPDDRTIRTTDTPGFISFTMFFG